MASGRAGRIAGWLIPALVACTPDPPASPETMAMAPRHTELAPLTATDASRFVQLSLDCVGKPYPNKPGHVYDGDDTLRPPQELTPAFYGCFDWHSAVHGHWAMLRVLHRFPALPEADEIRRKLGEHLSDANLAAELAFFQQPRSRAFERPYGWAWYMRLHAELVASPLPEARAWAEATAPLYAHFSAATIAYLERLSVPIRAGTHTNTAFALAHQLDAARTVSDSALEQAIVQRARDYYLADRDCPAHYEPSGEDFVSPCLAEADLMRRVLPAAEFRTWLDGFLDMAGNGHALLEPPEVLDPEDGRIGHLIGLSYQRGWCFMGIAGALAGDDPRRALFIDAAERHRQAAVAQTFASGYGGSHWLASFAIFLLT